MDELKFEESNLSLNPFMRETSFFSENHIPFKNDEFYVKKKPASLRKTHDELS